MAHCRQLRSLSFVAVVNMGVVETEGCETIKRLTIEGRRLKKTIEELLLGVDSVQCRQAEEKR